ncbi:MAG: DUF1622 domain-containing protein [Actinomycetota bacterium]|jgi:uncharacterized membrane protein|nr:DUF1622 domain-containing protein [Actinomycetota bacterium]
MSFEDAVEAVGKAVETVGIAAIVTGIALALFRFAIAQRDGDGYARCRQSIGRSILLGLELLVAGDIIRTVAISPNFRSVGVLALIVVIRTFLSFTLEVEINGRWPWQRRHDE